MKATLPSYREMLRQIIARPSITCSDPRLDLSNLPVIELLAEWLNILKFDVEILPVDGQTGKANLIASWGKGPGGLVLSGHSDTVPFDEGQWQSDPFTLTEKRDRFYGLGTADMKGFFPLVLEAVRTFNPEDIQQPLIIVATADEETSMAGAHELVKQGRPKARYAIIGEPTDLHPIRLHKGITMEAIRIRGRSGHSSNPALGNNALDAMHSAISAIMTWRDQLASQAQNALFVVPHTTVNLGCIHGGDNPNRICGFCELQIDIRPLPGMTLTELRAALKRVLLPVARKHQVELSIEPLFPGTPAFETKADSPLVKMAEKLTGYTANAVSFGTEAPFFNQLGAETIILGPGSIDQAHQANEYISHTQIQPGIEQIRHFIQALCISDELNLK